jgi:hypothetical protein
MLGETSVFDLKKKNKQYQCQLNEKINNLNSFEMTLKMLKTMQIYQECIF